MSTQELVSVGHLSQRCNIAPQRLLAVLLGQGHRPALILNGMLFFDAATAFRLAEQMKSGEPLPPANIIHGEPCPVEIHDEDDDDRDDDDEPEAPSPAPRFDVLHGLEHN